MALSKIDVANMLTGATPVANGGTGLSSGTTNQFLKFTGSTTLASAADNDTGKVLQVKSVESGGSQATINSTTFQRPINSNFYIEITPTASGNKFYVWGGPETDTQTMGVYYHIKGCVSTDGGSSWSDVTSSNTSFAYITGMTRLEGNLNYCVFEHTAANTNAHRFSYQAISGNGATNFYPNGRNSILVMEVAQ